MLFINITAAIYNYLLQTFMPGNPARIKPAGIMKQGESAFCTVQQVSIDAESGRLV
jgi:hypothetical protein